MTTGRTDKPEALGRMRQWSLGTATTAQPRAGCTGLPVRAVVGADSETRAGSMMTATAATRLAWPTMESLHRRSEMPRGKGPLDRAQARRGAGAADATARPLAVGHDACMAARVEAGPVTAVEQAHA